ncbi:unnamed protein product [Peronospora farinosa]|uniref:Chromo domain-containing protein n=1 Tax=Peronospora farinosa TaxID=134698 RepID=A0AAV0SS43_9STRA|nr:unnamed protein product [Peronospora farinosa]CAI5706992.1 unnamed protein product [Peronospora farinosa]
MPTDIERIVDRKLIKQRVHYLVTWKGFGEENNTWESRIDLMADGYSHFIKSFEDERKKESTTRGRSPGRSSYKSPRKSKSPGRGADRSRGRRSRSRSVSGSKKLRQRKSLVNTEILDNTETNGEVEKTAGRRSKCNHDTTESSSLSTQFVSRLDEDDAILLRSTVAALVPQVHEISLPSPSEKHPHKKSMILSYEEDEEPLLKAKKIDKETTFSKVSPAASSVHDRTDPVEDGLIAKAVESGYLTSFLSVAAVVGSLVASQMLPRVAEENTDLGRRWLSFLTPVVALLLFFHQKDARRSAKWVATGLVWRAAAELLLLIGDTPREFETMVAGSAIFANVSLLIALVSIIANGEHKQSKATLALLAVGAFMLFLSDSWVISTENPALESRVILMSMAVLTIALSPMPTESSEDDD